MRMLIRTIAFGVLGLGLLVVFTIVSQCIPGSPAAEAMSLVAIALGQDAASAVDQGAAEAVFEASHWYKAIALPALVGIFEGLLVGLFLRLRPIEAVATTLFFTVLMFAFGGKLPRDFESWLGPVLFLFCLMGGAQFVRGLRTEEKSA